VAKHEVEEEWAAAAVRVSERVFGSTGRITGRVSHPFGFRVMGHSVLGHYLKKMLVGS
jgi:hypothetical protein